MKVCRVCGTEDDKKTPMLKLFDNRKKHLLKQIEMLTGLMLSRLLGLPEHICDNCLQDLERASKFRERCIETQKQFHLQYVKQTDPAPLSIENDENTISIERYDEYETDLIEDEIADDNLNDLIEEDDTETQIWHPTNATENGEYQNILIESKKRLSEEPIRREESLSRKPRNKIYGPFVCELCGKSFNYVGNFREHQLRHTGNKQFNCNYCTFKFYTNKELVRHLRRHTGERPYACDYCDSRFTDLSTKTQHERRHTDERRFKCDQCDKTFVSSGCLKKHILTHTGVRSHCCTVCNIWFLRRTHLAAHFETKVHKRRALKNQFELPTDIESNDIIQSDENS